MSGLFSSSQNTKCLPHGNKQLYIIYITEHLNYIYFCRFICTSQSRVLPEISLMFWGTNAGLVQLGPISRLQVLTFATHAQSVLQQTLLDLQISPIAKVRLKGLPSNELIKFEQKYTWNTLFYAWIRKCWGFSQIKNVEGI